MKVHFIGIGGIGVSALARYYLKKDHKVSGSDLVETEITKALKKEGAKIVIKSKIKKNPHRESLRDNQNAKLQFKIQNLIKKADFVIYSLAVPKDYPELKLAKKYKIKCLSYPEALGELTKKYFTIAVSGTHGKSTTSSMVAILLKKAGLDPTVLIGTKLKEFGDLTRSANSRLILSHAEGSNCRVGKSKYLVIEADEYKGAFLNYWPKVIVLTSIEKEHLDYFKSEKNIFKTYKEYISHLPKDGFLIANKDDENISKLKSHIANPKFKIKNYSLKQKEAKKVKKVLRIPGVHNVSNALAVLNVAKVLQIPEKVVLSALSKYKGAWRRFEIIPSKLNKKSYTLISDYGHHPTEIKATLQAARERFDKKRIILVYQPHQYQRTKLLFKDFTRSFDEADYLILNEIYGVTGREKGSLVSSKDLAEAVEKRWSKKIKNVEFIKEQSQILKKLSKIVKKGDIVIVMGAGDIYNLTLKLID